jgi:putative hydrolase of the HAD superfamily
MMHVIWDLGGVLLEWNPETLAAAFMQGRSDVVLPPDFCLVEEDLVAVMTSREWADLDRGVLTPTEAAASLCGEDGEARRIADTKFFLENFVACMFPMPAGVRLLELCRQTQAARGGSWRTIVLSNFHRGAFEYVESTYDFFKHFDGHTVSSHVHANKPNPEIYQALLRDHALEGSDCVFIDDKLENVLAARAAGLHAIHCDTHSNVEAELQSMGLLQATE